MGYLLIIQGSAHDLDTLVVWVWHVSQRMDREHLVLVVDEGLFPKLMELKWSNEEYKDILIPC